jgi:hypothetical protein
LMFRVPFPLPEGVEYMRDWHALPDDVKARHWDKYTKANPNYERERLGLV